MLIKSFCICICRIRIRLFAHLWTVACAHPWISPISSTPRPNLRQRMGIIVKWKSFLRKELLVHNFFHRFCTYAHPPSFLWNYFLYIFLKQFSRIFVLLVMTKKIIFVFFSFFHMLWYVQFSLHPPFFTRCGIHILLNAIISTRNVAYAYLKRDVWYSFLMIITEKTNSAEINTQVFTRYAKL